MAEFSTFREQDGPIELKMVLTRDEAARLYLQLTTQFATDTSPALEFFIALLAASREPQLK